MWHRSLWFDFGLSFVIGIVLNWVWYLVIIKFEHQMKGGEIQSWILDLAGQAPVSEVYPTWPVGSGNLLAAAMNAPGQSLSLEMASRAAGGIAYEEVLRFGNLVLEFGMVKLL